MSVLVTGGAGFIGSHVVDHLVARGRRVVVLDDLSGGFEDNVNERAEFVRGSVTDHELLADLFERHGFEHVYHLAAYAAEGLSHFIRRFNYTNNVIGSVNLVNECVKHEVKCLVFTSSIAVYGPGQTPMTEAMTPEPEDPYGIAKYAVEMDLAAAKRMWGLNSIIFRPHNVYGERQNTGDKYRNVIAIFMSQVMRGEPCTVFGDGEQTRAFSYISDVAPAIADSVDYPDAYNQTFNVGADQPYSVNELAETVQRTMGRETGKVHLPPRKEVVHAFSDHSKARGVFGEAEPVGLEEGIGRMAAWVKETGPRSSEEFEGIEVEKNMPEAWRAHVAT